jgi:NAD(P) transhydrogenase subunit alpha
MPAFPVISGDEGIRIMDIMLQITIFTLAVFVGVELISKVPPTLHTPLMSGSNAISGITLIGSISLIGTHNTLATILGVLAVIFAQINVVGGFVVTHRMLRMFRKRKD